MVALVEQHGKVSSLAVEAQIPVPRHLMLVG